MEKENLDILARPKAPLKSLIEESRKIRSDRGEDFFQNKKSEVGTNLKNENINPENLKIKESKNNFKTIRENHLKLSQIISEYDEKELEKTNPVMSAKKTRSKAVHLYIDEKIEHFLNQESKKQETHWGLRKNAGLGQLIQKFILNFIEIKKREERQLKRVKKVIDEFRANLVEFKKNLNSPDDYLIAENANLKLKALSNDLRILLSLLEFEDSELKNLLGVEKYDWVEFILRWKYSQN